MKSTHIDDNNSQRIAACVKACVGIPTESLERNCVNVLITMAKQFLETQCVVTAAGIETAIWLCEGNLDLSYDDEDEDE